MPRAMPASIAELRVPNRDYPYFMAAERLAFRPEERGFLLENAWWCAELSFLVYVKEHDFVSRKLAEVGFRGAAFVSRKGYHALLAHDDDKVIVTFRGTVMTRPDNLMTDLSIKLVTHPHSTGRVHAGFLAALDQLWPDLEPRIRKLAEGRRLFFTGHSLGAALATLAATRSGDSVVYAFGSPRVGDGPFASAYPVRDLHRVVHEHDLVCFLPPPVLYRHVGSVVHLRRDGGITDGTDFVDRLRDAAMERIPGLFRGASGWREILANSVRENALSDHAPIGYCLRLWNRLEA